MKGNRMEVGVRERVFLADRTARAKARGPEEEGEDQPSEETCVAGEQ